MSHPSPSVLLTRSNAQSQRFADSLGDVNVVISPVFEVRYLDLDVDPRNFDWLIFTSENGIRAAAAAADMRGMRGYAVGNRTAQVGSEFGLDLRAASGNADDLVSLIVQENPRGRLLHVHGLHSRGRIAERLQSAGLEAESTIIYEQTECQLNESATALLGRQETVLLPIFSPRSAKLLGRMCRGARARLIIIGMSQAVLDAWTGDTSNEMISIGKPSAEAMRQEILKQLDRAA